MFSRRVFELLARFDDTVKLMEATLHRTNETSGEPETHPEVKRAALALALAAARALARSLACAQGQR